MGVTNNKRGNSTHPQSCTRLIESCFQEAPPTIPLILSGSCWTFHVGSGAANRIISTMLHDCFKLAPDRPYCVVQQVLYTHAPADIRCLVGQTSRHTAGESRNAGKIARLERGRKKLCSSSHARTSHGFPLKRRHKQDFPPPPPPPAHDTFHLDCVP